MHGLTRSQPGFFPIKSFPAGFDPFRAPQGAFFYGDEGGTVVRCGPNAGPPSAIEPVGAPGLPRAFVRLSWFRQQWREIDVLDTDFEGAASWHHPNGGGVHGFQSSDQGSADRGERRLIRQRFDLWFRGSADPAQAPGELCLSGAAF